MKKKRVCLLVILMFMLTIIFIFSLYSSSSYPPPRYASISEFETETGLKMFKFYNCMQYLENNLLTFIDNNTLITCSKTKKDNRINYTFEVDNCNYQVEINPKHPELLVNCFEYQLDNGILYQWSYTELYDVDIYTYTNVSMYKVGEIYCSITYKTFDVGINIQDIQKKMIEYFTLFDEINKEEFTLLLLSFLRPQMSTGHLQQGI